MTMADSPGEPPIDERERRRLLRRKGWVLCLEGVFIAGVGGILALIVRWFFEAGPTVPIVTSGFGLFLFIAGLVNVVKGRDRSGGKDIS
jgi:hypothetical protein